MNLKKGLTLKKYYCKLCHKGISLFSGLYGSGLCKSCSTKQVFKKQRPYNYSLINRICKYCNKTFKIRKNSKQKFCCVKCYGKSIIGINSLFFKGGKSHCIDCGKKLQSYGSKRCIKCSHQGKNNPRYKDGMGREPYAFDFNPKLKLAIRKRDNFTCQYCEMTEIEHLKKYGKVLEIHHKDHNRKNSNKHNLITTCKKCNLER